MAKIVVVGSGNWGSAIASLAWSNNHKTVIVSRSELRSKNMQNLRQVVINNKPYDIPVNVSITADLSSALKNADAVFIVVPVQEISDFINDNVEILQNCSAPLVMCSKGISRTNNKTPAEMISNIVDEIRIAVLSGPNFANEIINKSPAACVIAGNNKDNTLAICQLLSSSKFRAYHSYDVHGVSLCGALKNILAIASGILTGIKMGENARAALITRGLHEMSKYLSHAGAKKNTLYGLAGIGDVMLSCNSVLSRNYAFGLKIGKQSLENSNYVIDKFKTSSSKKRTLVEGIQTCHAISDIAKLASIDMPICQGLSDLFNEKCSISSLTHALITRPLTSEF